MSVSPHEEAKFESKLKQLLNSEITDWASDSFSDREFLLTLIKSILLTIPQFKPTTPWTDQEILNDSSVAKKTLQDALHKLMKNAVARSTRTIPEIHGYSTGDLAKFFGVSQTTINKWIDKKRFEGIQRETANQQIRISGDTWFTSSTGVRYQVKDVVQAWNKDQEDINSIPKVTEAELIANYLEYFRTKYKGEYEDTLGSKEHHELTDEEETDASIWSYFRERYLNDPQ